MDNASAVVDDLLDQYRKTGDRATAALDLQIEQKEGELSEVQDTVSRLERELAELRELRSQFEEQESAELKKARKELEDTPKDPSNPAIENWAGKLGMEPTELIEKIV